MNRLTKADVTYLEDQINDNIPDPKVPLKRRALLNKLLPSLHLDADGRLVTSDDRRLVPQEEKDALLTSLYKNPRLGGFRGRTTLLDLVKQGYAGVSKHDVAAFLKRQETQQVTLHNSRRLTTPSRPKGLGEWSIATFYMHAEKRDNDGVEAVFLVIDKFSKFLWTTPLKGDGTPSSKQIRDVLHGLFLTEGPPRILCSDGGAENQCDVTELCNAYGVDKRVSRPHYSPGNGAAEKAVQIVKRQLRKYMYEHGTRRWLAALPELTFAYNLVKHSATGYSPFEIQRNRGDVASQMLKAQRRQPVDCADGAAGAAGAAAASADGADGAAADDAAASADAADGTADGAADAKSESDEDEAPGAALSGPVTGWKLTYSTRNSGKSRGTKDRVYTKDGNTVRTLQEARLVDLTGLPPTKVRLLVQTLRSTLMTPPHRRMHAMLKQLESGAMAKAEAVPLLNQLLSTRRSTSGYASRRFRQSTTEEDGTEGTSDSEGTEGTGGTGGTSDSEGTGGTESSSSDTDTSSSVEEFVGEVGRRNSSVQLAINRTADAMIKRGFQRLERSAPKQLSRLHKGDLVRIRLNAGLACDVKRQAAEWSSLVYVVQAHSRNRYKLRRQDGRFDTSLSRKWLPRTLLLPIPAGTVPRQGT